MSEKKKQGRIEFRVDADEKEEMERAADDMGMKLSEYLRMIHRFIVKWKVKLN